MFRRNRKAEKRFAALSDEGNIPSFPSAVADAIQQIATPDVDLGEVAVTISADPGLTIAALKLANSPSFAPRSPITSVHQAAVLLGRNQLEALLIASGVGSAVPRGARPGYSPTEFWRTAGTRAAAASAVAEICDPSSQYEQFTAALLQDLAQPVLVHHDDAYADLLATHSDGHADIVAIEAEVLGWTHPEMGELLGEAWGLPEHLTRSISVHHADGLAGHEIAQWVSLIDDDDPDLDLLVAHARETLGLDPDSVVSVLEIAADRAGELAAIFN